MTPRGGPLLLPTPAGQHNDERRRLLEVEKRIMATGPPDRELLLCASYRGSTGGSGYLTSGRWYGIAAGLRVWGFHASAVSGPSGGDQEFSLRKNGTQVALVVIEAGANQGLLSFEEVPLGTWDYLDFYASVSRSTTLPVLTAMLRGPNAFSGGIELYHGGGDT